MLVTGKVGLKDLSGPVGIVKVMGDKTNGSVRWIEIAGLRFQPSELSKLIIILFYAYFFMKYQEIIEKNVLADRVSAFFVL